MATTVTLSMKLLIDKKAQRVLFAEASKDDVVDFLFFLLTLPVAAAVKLLGKESMVGCVGNLYASVGKFQSTYFQPGAAKDALLCPTVLSNNSVLRLPENTSPYRCTSTSYSCRSYVTAVYGRACPSCGAAMSTSVQLLPSAGFVQGIATYMVTDNLAVTRMSAVSSINLLNTFAGLAILKASLQSKTVLTDVFFGIKKERMG
ncbi:unnamed protein product [Urochloa decumbens]|uniref:DUF674 family protein n=1 Tax=Urochloa decumbens TaxID=240449 RepID=A0ABC8Z3Q1_9POAL